ncbi:gas vesicle protein GvpG [Streptomyces roseus]|uniref:Gas vesicle protein n=1 Tax=Streptomyces roseus TaxID=66430 RepID=A0A0J6XLM9_9ACTN|nr:gas vesicle protein GvpG [Streptomyces roseus]KMO96114.1 gas vesicle protein [Streptomyces roseus]MYT23778.1 gas vesicle protein [Streptomyces sp. SID7760]
MGLLTQLLTSPLAPMRAVVWVAQRVTDRANEEYYDPAPVYAALADLERHLLCGDIDQDTFDDLEDQLLDRLDEIARYRQNLP